MSNPGRGHHNSCSRSRGAKGQRAEECRRRDDEALGVEWKKPPNKRARGFLIRPRKLDKATESRVQFFSRDEGTSLPAGRRPHSPSSDPSPAHYYSNTPLPVSTAPGVCTKGNPHTWPSGDLYQDALRNVEYRGAMSSDSNGYSSQSTR